MMNIAVEAGKDLMNAIPIQKGNRDLLLEQVQNETQEKCVEGKIEKRVSLQIGLTDYEKREGNLDLQSQQRNHEHQQKSKPDQEHLQQQQQQQKPKRKHRRGKPKCKNGNKPYKKANWKFQGPRLNNAINNGTCSFGNGVGGGRRRCAGGGRHNHKILRSRPLVPYNTNKFLMEEHLAEIPSAVLTANGRTRDSSFSMDSEDNYFFSLPEDEEEFLTKEFANVYEKARLERLENLSKQELIEECLQIEDRYSKEQSTLLQRQHYLQRVIQEHTTKIRVLEEKMRELSRENYNLRCQLMRTTNLAAAAAASPPSASTPLAAAYQPVPMDSSSEDSESDSSSSSSSSSTTTSISTNAVVIIPAAPADDMLRCRCSSSSPGFPSTCARDVDNNDEVEHLNNEVEQQQFTIKFSTFCMEYDTDDEDGCEADGERSPPCSPLSANLSTASSETLPNEPQQLLGSIDMKQNCNVDLDGGGHGVGGGGNEGYGANTNTENN